jgi:hypothetical protein
MVTAYRPTNYVEQLRYLERVARYVRAERRRKAVQQRKERATRRAEEGD